jgi:hypothetical protein
MAKTSEGDAGIHAEVSHISSLTLHGLSWNHSWATVVKIREREII